MTPNLRRRAALAILATLCLCPLACGEDDSSSSGGSAGGSSKPAEKQEASGDKTGLKIGDETTLKGLKGSLKVKILGIEDPLGSPPTERPKAGRHFVGVRIRLTNLGRETYKDAPLNGSRLVTTPDKAANPTILLSGKCPSKFGTGMRLAAGASKTACLPFQVKRGAKVTAFEFRLDSGFGPETGEWTVE